MKSTYPTDIMNYFTILGHLLTACGCLIAAMKADIPFWYFVYY